MFDLNELDEMLAGDRYSTRNALAVIPEHAWAITPMHSSSEFALLNVDIRSLQSKKLEWVRSVCLKRNALTSAISKVVDGEDISYSSLSDVFENLLKVAFAKLDFQYSDSRAIGARVWRTSRLRI